MVQQSQKLHDQKPPMQYDERILVVARDKLFPDGAWHGIKNTNFDEYVEIIAANKQFLWRSVMEEDAAYKQIIPYLIFQYNGTYFMMQRKPNASAKALQNKFSLGIGGHVRQEDVDSNSLFDWAKREFMEEVSYNGAITAQFIGILNDDTNFIGKVHLGLVMLLKGDSPNITIKSEHKSGTLITLDECATYYDRMETWSQMILAMLQEK